MVNRHFTTVPRSAPQGVVVLLLSALVGLIAIAPGTASARPVRSATTLTGTLQLTAGTCAGGKVTGTYLRMILPSGTANGPYMSNSDSHCADQTFTPLAPGSDGGLRVGSYQAIPSPAFSPSGDARAHRITAPAAFYGTSFATATNPVDPQTRKAVPAPRLTLTGSTLTADLRSFSVTWNNQHFNQGAPKPDGSTPGNTRVATGTYDARTGGFTLDWTSQVVGGPFDKFTGKWHLAGRFVPAAGSAPAAPANNAGGTAAPGAAVPGAGATVGQPSTGAVAAPGAGAAPAPAKAGGVADTSTGGAATAAPATTRTVVTEKWHASTPLVALAVGIALLVIGALVLVTVIGRRAEPA